MAKKTKITVGCIVFLIIACGLIWWFMPIHFLREVVPEEVAMIKVINGNNGDEFEVTSPDDISYIVNTIKQIALKKNGFTSGVDYYYILTIINENGEEMDSFGIQNPYILRRDDAFYRCNGELGAVAEYLEDLEAALFPDYKKDPDFPYSNIDGVKQDSFQIAGQATEDVMLSCTGIVEDSSNEEMYYEIQICCIDLTNYHLYFKLYDQTAIVQEIECPIEFDLMARTIETPVIMTDINEDGIKDFILDYGISGHMTLGQCIVWNADKNQYEILEGYSELWNPHYDMRQRVIWEMRHEEAAIYIINQYEVIENKLELRASLIEDYGTGQLKYTETRMIDGEMVTIHENASEGEISLEEWYYH